MTTLSYYTATTLDGFIADPDDSLEWLFRQEQDESGPLNYDEFIQNIGAIVMGSTTYEWILEHQAKSGGPLWPYSMPAWVLSSRDLSPPADADVRFATGGVRPVYDAMVEAADGKDLWVVGGGDLAGQFADAGLLDEVIVYVAPVTLGAGRPLLSRRLDLELVEAHRNRAFVCARYSVAGRLAEDRPEGDVADHARG
jgi:dihydrofolate reductase